MIEIEAKLRPRGKVVYMERAKPNVIMLKRKRELFN